MCKVVCEWGDVDQKHTKPEFVEKEWMNVKKKKEGKKKKKNSNKETVDRAGDTVELKK